MSNKEPRDFLKIAPETILELKCPSDSKIVNCLQCFCSGLSNNFDLTAILVFENSNEAVESRIVRIFRGNDSIDLLNVSIAEEKVMITSESFKTISNNLDELFSALGEHLKQKDVQRNIKYILSC